MIYAHGHGGWVALQAHKRRLMFTLTPAKGKYKITLSTFFKLYRLSHSFHSLSNHHLFDLFLTLPLQNFRTLLQFHSLIITSGNSNNLFFSAKLISLYTSFHQSNVSTQVFNTTHPKDTFLWNSIIKSHFGDANYRKSVEFYSLMRLSDTPVDQFTVPMVVTACAELADVEVGRYVHGVAFKLDLFEGNSASGSSFIYLYSKCCRMEDARIMFEEMPIRDVVAWTSIIVGFVNNDESEEGLNCLRKMFKSVGDGIWPNSRTVEGGFQACGNLVALSQGRSLHCFALKTGIVCCSFVRSSLFLMYMKCKNLEETLLAFLELPTKDLISWTSVIGVHAKEGHIDECFDLFQAMLQEKVDPDGIIISCLLVGIRNFASIKEGKVFHGLILRKSFQSDVLVCNSLLSMYCTFECSGIAERIFDTMHEKNSESWNCMVFGYGQMGLEKKCFEFFRDMLFSGLESDANSLVAVICSCARLGALRPGRAVHCYSIKKLIDGNVSVINSLVSMYGKCGNLNVAKKLFHLTSKDIVTWNTLISACAHSGHSSEALVLFNEMLLEDVKPNSATLLSVLSASANLADLNHGEWVHNYINETGLECGVSLSTALVDMYAKCGQLGISRKLFNSLPGKDVISWNVMISGYGLHGNANDALEVFREMESSGLKPNELTFLAVLAACSHGGLVEEGKYLFNKMTGFYSILPTLKHYACMVDLLGRSGNLIEAEDMILKMPFDPDGGVWGALLGACNVHINVEMGERVARRAFAMDPENDGYYILMSNIYSSAGLWEKAEEMRMIMKNRSVKKNAGWSAMELDGEIHTFLVGDKSYPSTEQISTDVESLFRQMEQGYINGAEFGLCCVE